MYLFWCLFGPLCLTEDGGSFSLKLSFRLCLNTGSTTLELAAPKVRGKPCVGHVWRTCIPSGGPRAKPQGDISFWILVKRPHQSSPGSANLGTHRWWVRRAQFVSLIIPFSLSGITVLAFLLPCGLLLCSLPTQPDGRPELLKAQLYKCRPITSPCSSSKQELCLYMLSCGLPW